MAYRHPSVSTPFSRRTLLGTAAGASALALAPRFAGAAQETDWLTSGDLADMPETPMRYWFYESPERTALGK